MKYINNTEESIKYRTGSLNEGYDWGTVKPGQIVDIPEDSGENLPLTPLGESNEKQETEKVEESTEEMDEEAEEEAEDESLDYFKKLVAVKGIGKRTAEDIMEKYPTEEDLIKAVQADEEIHNRDDVDELVKELYQE